MNNYIKLNILGKNIDRFIKKLIINKIDILKLDYISNKEINLLIKKNDYKKVIKLKSIYKIKILDYKGMSEFKNIIIKNKILLLAFVIGILIIFLLSNIIFSIKVIHTDKEIKELLLDELNNYGVKIHNFKKSKKQIEKIKNKILNKYKDKLEWIEIENKGTSYIVRVEERLINKENKELKPRNIIAKKNAVILNMNISNGTIIKDKGNYVHKGDIIVDGTIRLNDTVKDYTVSKGIIYGEVWYTIKVEYPFIYKETKYTNNSKKVFVYTFLNKEKGIFSELYTNYKKQDMIRLSSTFLPIFLSYSKINEVKEIDKIYTEEEALEMAIIRSKKEINNKLNENEYIINSKILNVEYKENKIVLEIFYSICEDITEYKDIIINEGE